MDDQREREACLAITKLEEDWSQEQRTYVRGRAADGVACMFNVQQTLHAITAVGASFPIVFEGYSIHLPFG